MSNKLMAEAAYLAMAFLSTALANNWFMEIVVATGTLMIAKIVDHYFRKKVIAFIDKIAVKIKNLKNPFKPF